MDVLGVELTGFTGPNQMLCIGKGRRPVEAVPYRYPGQGVRGGMVGAQPPMDIGQQLQTLFSGDALE